MTDFSAPTADIHTAARTSVAQTVEDGTVSVEDFCLDGESIETRHADPERWSAADQDADSGWMAENHDQPQAAGVVS